MRWKLLQDALTADLRARQARERIRDITESMAADMVRLQEAKHLAREQERIAEIKRQQAQQLPEDASGPVVVWRFKSPSDEGHTFRVAYIRRGYADAGKLHPTLIHIEYPFGFRAYDAKTGRSNYHPGTIDVPATIANWRAYCIAQRTPPNTKE